MIIEIKNLEELENMLSQTDGKHILKISNTGCIPCKAINPFIEEFSEEFPDISFYSLVANEVEDPNEVGVKLRALRISSVPTFIILNEGEETRLNGAYPKTKLKELLTLS